MYVRNQLNKDYMKIDPRVHREQTRKRWKGKEPGSRTEMFRARNKRDRIRNATSIRYFARYNIDTRTRVSSLVTYIRTYVGRDRGGEGVVYPQIRERRRYNTGTLYGSQDSGVDVCLAIRYDRRISPVSQKIRGLPLSNFLIKFFSSSFLFFLSLSPSRLLSSASMALVTGNTRNRIIKFDRFVN